MGVLVAPVGTSVTTICTVGSGFPITIKNQGPATVFIDFEPSSSSVTADQSSTGGYPLEPGEHLTNPPMPTFYTVFGITAEGTAYVSAIG